LRSTVGSPDCCERVLAEHLPLKLSAGSNPVRQIRTIGEAPDVAPGKASVPAAELHGGVERTRQEQVGRVQVRAVNDVLGVAAPEVL